MRTSALWALVLAVWVMAGCTGRESKRVKVYPVRGSVFFNGMPAAGAVVRVHGAGGEVLSRGVVQKDGAFSLTTYEAEDGVPAGHYRVSVYWRRPVAEGERDGPSLIPERYSRPESSGLEVEIKPGGDNALSPFHLKP